MSAADTAARTVAEPELRGLLNQVERRGQGTRLLLVAADPRWDGPDLVDSALGPVRVVAGPSPLAVRIAMVDHPDEFLAVLTPLSAAELGEEVLARAWKGRPVRPSPWDAVASLFRVQQIDPSLRKYRWMLDLLVQLAPSTGYPQPMSQVLDRQTAWRTLYLYGLGIASGPNSTTDLLRWAQANEAANALTRLAADTRQTIAAQLAIDVGPAAEPIIELVASGTARDAVAIGLTLDALWPGPDPAVRVRLEERHLHRTPMTDGAAADWAAAAREILLSTTVDDHAATLQRAESILDDVDPEGTADSAILESGLARRLDHYGRALAAAIDADTEAALDEARATLRHACAHELADAHRARLLAAEAAFRLARRQHQGVDVADAGDLTTLTREYLTDGGWVDACRQRLAEGETIPSLASAYETLLSAVDEKRRARDRVYARAVAAEAVNPTAAASLDSARPLRIEQVLDTIVTRVAEQHPVLVLVVDGLSHAAAVPMVDDLTAAGWRVHGPAGRDVPGVIAALPTVTICSRASLLSGRLVSGSQDVERDGFEGHAGLAEASDGQRPRLFHKSDLRVSEGEVAPDVLTAISDARQRVVGVVVNGVDDFLGAGGQVRLADGLDGVPLLRQVLGAALEADRVVVITSDHGHIVGADQRVVAPNGGGERFRLVGDAPADDEVLLEGPRVLRGDGRIVAAADDGVRYIGVAKHGYHGGATPAEVLCPLFVLASHQTELDGWQPVLRPVPTWWDPDVTEAHVEFDTGGDAPGPTPETPAATSEPQLSLLEPDVAAPTPAARPAWLAQLLEAPRLHDQRRLAGRVALDDDELAKLLRVLVASGGTASGTTLQRLLDVPGTRLRGKLEAARSLLGVDGYPVLRIEADGTAALNVDLLVQQFEIDHPGPKGAS